MSPTPGCPEPEELAVFAEGVVSAGERLRIEEHLASCEECCAVLAGVVREREERMGRVVVRPFRFRAAAWTSAAAAVLVTAIAVWHYSGDPGFGRPVVRGVGPLVSVATDRRPIDARVTGGFPWVPPQPLERSGSAPRTTPTWELLAAATQVRKEAQTDPSLENRHALGIAHLVIGELDEAVAVLREVVRDDPSRAKAQSDLAAALLARGEMKGRPEDLIEALSRIDKALASDGTLREALFNRAVALEKLHLDDEAEAAWKDYLERQPEEGWSGEARERLERIARRRESSDWEGGRRRIEEALARSDAAAVAGLVADRTLETRLWVQDELLGSWAQALSEGRGSDAARALATATALADSLMKATADPTARDLVATAREASAGGESARLDALVRGHLAYRRAMELDRRSDSTAARPKFEQAERELRGGGSVLALSASLGLARCDWYGTRLDAAAARLDRVIAAAERDGYLSLAAQAHSLLGLVDVAGNRFGASLVHYGKALDTYERIREAEHAAKVRSLLSEAMLYLGDDREAWRYLLGSLEVLPRVREAGRAISILMQAAIAVAERGYPDVALRFGSAAVERALRDGDSVDRADSHLLRVGYHCDLGRFDEAGSDLAAARAWIARVNDPAYRGRLEAEGRFAAARLAYARADSGEAIEVLTTTIDYFRQGELELRLPELYLLRGRASWAAGRPDAAQRDLEAGIDIFERRREAVADDRQRVSYFDTAHDLFDEIMALEVSRGRSDAALDALEQGKTRDLLGPLAGSVRPAGDRSTRAIPEGITVVAYGVLPDRLLVWALSRADRSFRQEGIRASDLSELVRNFREELESPPTDRPLRAAARLYELLVDPVSSSIARFGTVVFVPDGALHAVPFAALLDARTSRFLVQDHAVVVAPSIALFERATARAGAMPEGPGSLLAVGDPAFDTAAFPSMPRLGGAAEEAKRVAAFYAHAELLIGPDATKQRFLAALDRHAVVHLAGHALANETDPMRSRLLFAPDPERGDAGILFAEELYGRPLGNVRLVVLAACSTGTGRISRSEGPLSLARPFLAGGVPAVLATHWEIEDQASAELLTAFHRDIAKGRAPEEALRDAQVGMIESGNAAARAPRSWAGFQLSGGVEGTPSS